jgi:hypothetical protein
LLTQLLALSGSNTAKVGFIDYPLPAIPGGFNNQDQIASFVPEPSSWALLGLGVLGVLGYAWRRRKRPDPGLVVRSRPEPAREGRILATVRAGYPL